jgi:hypothetical protein
MRSMDRLNVHDEERPLAQQDKTALASMSSTTRHWWKCRVDAIHRRARRTALSSREPLCSLKRARELITGWKSLFP